MKPGGPIVFWRPLRHSLRDLQERFAEAVFNPRSYGLGLPIRENGLNGRRRLHIYRNNVFASLTEALRACYPVVKRLVGAGFFAYMANRYIRSHPSTSGDLQEFGSELPEFLEDFSATRALVYLSDVARLEWARQYAYHALEPEVFGLSTRLQAVPPQTVWGSSVPFAPGRPVAVLALSNTADLAGQPGGL